MCPGVFNTNWHPGNGAIAIVFIGFLYCPEKTDIAIELMDSSFLVSSSHVKFCACFNSRNSRRYVDQTIIWLFAGMGMILLFTKP